MNDLTFVSILFWQIIAVGSLWCFRDEIASLLTRITAATIFGQKIVTANIRGELNSKTGVDGHVGPILSGQALSVSATFKPALNPTAIYFFSHDFMLTYAAVLTGSRKAVIELAAASAQTHFKTLGFDTTPVDYRFASIVKRVYETKQSEWTNDFRGELADDIWIVSRFIGEVIQKRLPVSSS